MDFISIKTLLVIAHIFGVALGAGGAFMSDAMFLKSARDRRFSKTEIGFLKLGSIMVWSGVFVLVASGAVMVGLNPERYLDSAKFLAKMTVVAVIILNGLVFHFWHLPLIDRHKDAHFPTSDEFMRKRIWVLVSGGISGVSWASAIILGVLRGLPYSYGAIMLVYFGALILSVGAAVALRDHILPKHRFFGRDEA